MKKWFFLALVAFAATSLPVQAQDDSDWNEQKYIAKTMRMAQKKPNWNPTKADLKARFEELDTDADGVLTYDERVAGRKENKKKNK